MQGAAIIMLAAASVQNTPIGNVVAGAIFPYQIGTYFRAAASANAYYIISPGSCNQRVSKAHTFFFYLTLTQVITANVATPIMKDGRSVNKLLPSASPTIKSPNGTLES